MRLQFIKYVLVVVLDLEPHDGITLDQIVVDTKINLFELAGWLEIFQVHMSFAEALVETNVRVHDLDPEFPVISVGLCSKAK